MTPTGRPQARGGRRRKPERSPDRPKTPPEELKPTLDPPPIEHFREWPLDPLVLAAIEEMGIETPTPIQRLAIGPVLAGRDVIAKAETGTGKTLAFGAPMVSKLDADRSSVLGLVLCPTRELAQQVESVLKALGKPKGLKTALVVGGDPIPPQVAQLKAGAQLVVATPGRVLDLVGQKWLNFPWTEFAVLDEADEMLEIGFLDDVRKILDLLPEERQTLLFSATFPPPLLELARSHTKNPVEMATAKGLATVDRIQQHYCEVGDEDKLHVLRRLIRDSSSSDLFLVFCDRRTEVDRVFRFLERLPYPVKALHGGYDQAARFRVMSAFRSGEVRALVATDVASRGLDVTGVTHVINCSAPRDVSDYTHRIGRTGRAGRSGIALTFVTPTDRRRWRELEGRMTWEVPRVDQEDLGSVILGLGRGRDEDRERPRRERTREERGGERPEERSEQRRPRVRSAARDERPPREERPREDRPRGDRSPDRQGTHREEPPRSTNERRVRDEAPRRRTEDERSPRSPAEREAPRRAPREERATAPRELDARPPRSREPLRDPPPPRDERRERSRANAQPAAEAPRRPRRSEPSVETRSDAELGERPLRRRRSRGD
jgi:ATP-dependent RNA helicase DeaD